MKRSELKRKTPMQRTAFKPHGNSKPLFGPDSRKLTAKSRMKTRRPVMTPIRKSAKGEECTIGLPSVCNYDPATTVLCHSNELADGKGMGLKAPDTCAAYGCSACHDVVDGRAPRPEALSLEVVKRYFERAIEKTRAILQRKGLMQLVQP